jgi:hypothetical protein
MLKLLRPLIALLALGLLTANAASALAAVSLEKPASGSLAVADNRVSQNTRLSEEAVRGNLDLSYDFASDSPVAAEGGLADLAAFRSELGLAEAAPGTTTLARLDIGDESFYGISGHGQEITFDINAVSATHAEADAFQQAMNAGVSSPNAMLYIDNVNGVCGYCLNSGLSSMMRALGVDSLTVVSPQGTMIFGP